jgi:hypothetical protein
MSLWRTWQQADQKWKVLLIGGCVLLLAALLLSPLFSVGAYSPLIGQETVSEQDSDGDEATTRDPTNGIIALGVLLVLIVVLSTTRILTLDRQHRPHLRRLRKHKNGQSNGR